MSNATQLGKDETFPRQKDPILPAHEVWPRRVGQGCWGCWGSDTSGVTRPCPTIQLGCSPFISYLLTLAKPDFSQSLDLPLTFHQKGLLLELHFLTLWFASFATQLSSHFAQKIFLGGAWVAQPAKRPTLAQVCEFEPHIGLCADSRPGTCFRFCVSLSLCPSSTCSLSPSQK